LSHADAALIALSGEERCIFFGEMERLTTPWSDFKIGVAMT
jgi:hypothetical protein